MVTALDVLNMQAWVYLCIALGWVSVGYLYISNVCGQLNDGNEMLTVQTCANIYCMYLRAECISAYFKCKTGLFPEIMHLCGYGKWVSSEECIWGHVHIGAYVNGLSREDFCAVVQKGSFSFRCVSGRHLLFLEYTLSSVFSSSLKRDKLTYNTYFIQWSQTTKK